MQIEPWEATTSVVVFPSSSKSINEYINPVQRNKIKSKLEPWLRNGGKLVGAGIGSIFPVEQFASDIVKSLPLQPSDTNLKLQSTENPTINCEVVYDINNTFSLEIENNNSCRGLLNYNTHPGYGAVSLSYGDGIILLISNNFLTDINTNTAIWNYLLTQIGITNNKNPLSLLSKFLYCCTTSNATLDYLEKIVVSDKSSSLNFASYENRNEKENDDNNNNSNNNNNDITVIMTPIEKNSDININNEFKVIDYINNLKSSSLGHYIIVGNCVKSTQTLLTEYLFLSLNLYN